MKHLLIISILLIITACSKSSVLNKPMQEPPQYIIDLSFIKMEAVLKGDTLIVTITNLSNGAIAIDKPWFGPCSTINVYSKGNGYCINPLGSAIGTRPIKLIAGEKIIVNIPINSYENQWVIKDDTYRIVYYPYNGLGYSVNHVECTSILIKN